MLYILFLYMVGLLFPTDQYQNAQSALFPIFVEDKIGFIDSTGRVVIQPRFRAANNFSEGLCAVRIDGLYGFIDGTGKTVIPLQYDYATYFKEDLAIVYKNGKAFFIDKDGNKAFNFSFEGASAFEGGRSFVHTKTGKKGVIDRTGKLVIDTLYRELSPFVNGFAIAEGIHHQPYESEKGPQKLEIGIIDSNGVLTVPFGKYSELSDMSEGFVVFKLPAKRNERDAREGIIDCRGNVVYLMPDHSGWIDGGVHQGIFRLNLPKSKRSDVYNDVYFDLKGKKIFGDKNFQYGEDFSDGRAFVEDDKRVSVIDRTGRFIVREKFLSASANGFEHGRALVRTSEGWGVIDTTGTYILKPVFPQASEATLINDVVIINESKYYDSVVDYKHSVISLKGEVIISGQLQYVDHNGFVNGLLRAVKDNLFLYYNMNGDIVWEQELWDPALPHPFNIDFMTRGYFCAPYEFTGHGSSGENSATRKIGVFNDFQSGVLSVVAKPTETVVISKVRKGMRVYIANMSSDTISFNAQDSRLNMKVQAKDFEGNWRDIEYLPSSWCGNSYHITQLPSDHFWQFDAPVYQGIFPTVLRIELEYIDPAKSPNEPQRHNKNVRFIYSNEFMGSINPGQLWRKEGYRPNGIMDPYNE